MNSPKGFEPPLLTVRWTSGNIAKSPVLVIIQEFWAMLPEGSAVRTSLLPLAMLRKAIKTAHSIIVIPQWMQKCGQNAVSKTVVFLERVL